MAKKNYTNLIVALSVSVLSILGLIFMLTTSFVARNDAFDDYFRIFYNGDTRFRLNDFILNGDANNFPEAVPVLVLIGIITILIGCTYMSILEITKKNCFISNRKAPGPISGSLFFFGGLIGFIGLMVFVPYGVDTVDSSSSFAWGFGFVFSAIVFILLLLFGIYLLVLTLTNKDKKRKSKKKK